MRIHSVFVLLVLLYYFAITIIYSPGILILTFHKGIEILRGQESIKEDYLESPEQSRTPQSPAVGGGVPFILPFPIPPPVAPLQIPPAPVDDNPFVGVLHNARKK